jgi:putative ABC transport system ATP-binding protein
LILADEPTGELDSTTAAAIFQLLLEVVERENVTIITTTHDRLVMEKAQRVLELADGALQDGVTSFEKDRREAIAVPWTPRAQPLPSSAISRPAGDRADDEEVDPQRWARPQRRQQSAIYQPPRPPNEPL